MHHIKNFTQVPVYKQLYAFGSWQALAIPVTKIVSVQEKDERD